MHISLALDHAGVALLVVKPCSSLHFTNIQLIRQMTASFYISWMAQIPEWHLTQLWLQIRIGMALASVLGRVLVIPQLWCGADRWWAPHMGIIPGSALLLPFACPLDHVLDLEQYAPHCCTRILLVLKNVHVWKEAVCGCQRSFSSHPGLCPAAALCLPLDHVLDLEQCAPCCITTFLESRWGNLY